MTKANTSPLPTMNSADFAGPSGESDRDIFHQHVVHIRADPLALFEQPHRPLHDQGRGSFRHRKG